MTKIRKYQLKEIMIPFLPKNKRGFKAKVDWVDIFLCIVHKLKTGCQWKYIFVDIAGVQRPCSCQLVYYYYRKWCKKDVFEIMYKSFFNPFKRFVNGQIFRYAQYDKEGD